MDIIKKYERLIKSRAKINAELETLKGALDCPHPENHLHKYKQDVDNGYGKWWTVEMCTCMICGKSL